MATQRKDGRWVARQRTETGRVCGYGKTPQEADADLAEKLRLDREVISELPTAPTLHDVAELLWVPRIQSLEASTRHRYEGAYKAHIRDKLGSLPVDQITRPRVQAWVNQLAASPKSVRLYVTILRSLMNLAINEGYATQNPVGGQILPKLPPKRERILSLDRALEVLDHFDTTPIALPVFLAMTLGLRRGEIAGLKWEDIDRRAGAINIRRQRVGVTRVGVHEKNLKTRGSNRTLRLRPEHMAAIDRRADLDSEYVTTYRMEPWVPDTITEFWNLGREKVGLSDWSFHDLRHLAAGLLYASGASLIEISAVLGHASVDMTLGYTSITEKQVREALEKQPTSLFR